MEKGSPAYPSKDRGNGKRQRVPGQPKYSVIRWAMQAVYDS
jgi:hypothetical protein